MRPLFIIIITSLLYLPEAMGHTLELLTTDTLMARLKTAIQNRDTYIAEKESIISDLTDNVKYAKGNKEKFEALSRLCDEYHSFNADSAYFISLRLEKIAEETGDRALILNARMKHANVLSSTGMFHETLEIINDIQAEEVPEYLLPYYYHIKRTVYGRIADYSAFSPERERYLALTDAYRDSLMDANTPNTLGYELIRADQLNVHNHPQAAINVLNRFMAENELSEHEQAICAWTLAESYGRLNDRENQKKYLIISAISDMKSGVREYASLRLLAQLLYQEGNLDMAYKLITIALDDAAKCNAKQRIVEINDTYPMINSIYLNTVNKQKQSLERTIIIITVLSILLVIFMVMMLIQMRKKAKVSKQLKHTNLRLEELNTRLRDSNRRLTAANDEIMENSRLKEVYISRYMDQCLNYIEKLDNYRIYVGRQLNSGKEGELRVKVKSRTAIDEEYKQFYYNFDKTFLSLFPTFVEDFNNLLQPEKRIYPNKEDTLTPELRIFALIRLGIIDSEKIAKFLRYSLTTIYNYRTKVRNKALGDRSELEAKVARIAQIDSTPTR